MASLDLKSYNKIIIKRFANLDQDNVFFILIDFRKINFRKINYLNNLLDVYLGLLIDNICFGWYRLSPPLRDGRVLIVLKVKIKIYLGHQYTNGGTLAEYLQSRY